MIMFFITGTHGLRILWLIIGARLLRNSLFNLQPKFRIIDWDDVYPVPLSLTHLTLGERIILPGEPYFVNPELEDLYLQTLERLQVEKGISIQYQNSAQMRFLDFLLRSEDIIGISGLMRLGGRFNSTLNEILNPSPEALQHASDEWNEFTNTFFKNHNRPVPEWPVYIQIQEELGIYKNSTVDRARRALRKKALTGLSFVLGRLTKAFPDWAWASRSHCYATATVWNRYRLPSGKYSC